ncbi:MAG: transporter related protein [Actinomycetia bacterium]|nr:transporter related protein [Actinomycetes bacterium]
MVDWWQFALLGMRTGGAFALVALGVVVIFRGSGVLNFSQGALGMASTYVFWELWHGGDRWPLVPSIIVAVAAGALLGIAIYWLVIRRMQQAADLTKVIATLGILILLQSLATIRYGVDPIEIDPLFGSGGFTVLGGYVSSDTAVILGTVLALTCVLSLLFRFTKLGMRSTALRERPMAAEALGISPHRPGFVTWGLGAALGALGGILLLPYTGLAPSRLTLLVIPAFAAGLLGRFTALFLTVGIALGLGIVQSEMVVKLGASPAVVSAVPFVVIVLALMAGGKALPARGSTETLRLPAVGGGGIRPVPVLVLLAGGIAAAFGLSGSWSSALITTGTVGLLGLSIVVVTGYAGQISLAPFALAGMASLMTAASASRWHMGFVSSLLIGVVTATVVGVLVGAPAVRVRGVNLAIATIGLAMMIESAVLNNSDIVGINGIAVPGARLFGMDIEPGGHPERFAVLCIVVLALAAMAVGNMRASQSGRRYVSVRANERGAAALGISVSGAKLSAFAVSAALAGLSGALSTYRYRTAVFDLYTVFNSITTLAMTLLMSVGFVIGGVLAGANAVGGVIPFFVEDIVGLKAFDTWLPALSGVFLIDIMTRSPDGLVFKNITDAKRRRERRAAKDGKVVAPPPPAVLGSASLSSEMLVSDVPAGTKMLEVKDLTVRYGPTVAVREVSLDVYAGRVLGILGPNGAGKTTLIDGITGFAADVEGKVLLDGDAVHGAPHRRARAGLGRTFQSLELFEDLSVRENLLTALDDFRRRSYVVDLFLPDRSKLSPAAEAAVSLLGLGDALDTKVADLPQGRRRMVAIARAIAQRPKVLCLDEPAAGLNGPERQVASSVFRALATELNLAILLVEHNVDVVSDTCDEVVVLDFGEVIARGTPGEVLSDPVVRAAYLGSAAAVVVEPGTVTT